MKKLDFPNILYAIWKPFIFWAAAVVIVAFGGRQPGVVCTTPLAWGMALWVGMRAAANTRSGEKGARLIEALLAGGIFGLLQGLLFAVVAPFMGGIKPEEQSKATIITVAMIVVGAIVSAVLSLAIASSQERRRTDAKPRRG
jgi:hypothetical protein